MVDTGTRGEPGIFNIDVPTHTVIGNVQVVTGSGIVINFTSGGTATTNYGLMVASVNSQGQPNKRC